MDLEHTRCSAVKMQVLLLLPSEVVILEHCEGGIKSLGSVKFASFQQALSLLPFASKYYGRTRQVGHPNECNAVANKGLSLRLLHLLF
jgi:hypothetical protein